MAKGRDPYIKFFTTDYLEDMALKSCSLAAQGLWARMFCMMHQGDPYGHLAVNGTAIPDGKLHFFVGKAPNEVAKRLAELEAAGVPSREYRYGLSHCVELAFL